MLASLNFHRWQHWWRCLLSRSLCGFSVVSWLTCFWSMLRVERDITFQWGENPMARVRVFPKWVNSSLLLNTSMCITSVHSVVVTVWRQVMNTVEMCRPAEFRTGKSYERDDLQDQSTDESVIFFFPMALQPPMGPWPTSMKLSVSLRFF
jgi:hypothetical protein